MRTGPGPVLDRAWGPGSGPSFLIRKSLLAGAVFNVGCLFTFWALVLWSQVRFVVPGWTCSPTLDLETYARLVDTPNKKTHARLIPTLDL